MRVLAMASQKGGSGKTTLSGHLAVQAQMAGAGPVCLIDIPAGRYNIVATTQGGESKSQTVTVGGGSKTASFRF